MTVAIVTGAGSRPAGPDGPIVGNGRATAIVLAREGARVVLVDERRDWAEGTLDMIEREQPVPPPKSSSSLSPCRRRILWNGMPSRETSTCAKGA